MISRDNAGANKAFDAAAYRRASRLPCAQDMHRNQEVRALCPGKQRRTEGPGEGQGRRREAPHYPDYRLDRWTILCHWIQ